jgi:uncharacterized protein YjbJ (UPF0337 family)
VSRGNGSKVAVIAVEPTSFGGRWTDLGEQDDIHSPSIKFRRVEAVQLGEGAIRLTHRFLKRYTDRRVPMNQDELKGKADQVKGRVKQGVGDLTDNERLHDEGVADEAGGDVQEGFGRARRKVGETIEDIGEDIKR